jgi:23S rRNA (adenine2030-N6)-methyltransferase
MNYRHAYHAGNFADVHKHASLTLLLGHLLKKDTAFHVLDCHAGIGRYDLTGVEANKTAEFRAGIARVMRNPDPILAPYLALVRFENEIDGLSVYPGSPLLIRKMMRRVDRLTLVELHEDDAALLRGIFNRDRQVTIREEDAYQAMKASLPPRERRGLVLIDPPYEAKDEFQRVTQGLAEGLRRWPTGIYAIWYPIKSPAECARFKSEVRNFGVPCLASEIMLLAPDREDRLNGSGLLLINPPWQLDEQLELLMTCLHSALGCQGETKLQWLVTG